MKILYLVQAHKDPEQLGQLIKTLLDEDVYFIVNIDGKADFSQFESIPHIAPGQIHMVADRNAVFWGDVSQIDATLEMIRLAVTLPVEFDYACFLSGQDFPILSNQNIKLFFTNNKGTNYLDFNSLPFHRWGFNGGIGRLKYYWFVRQLGIKISRLLYYFQKMFFITRKLPKNGRLYGGSSWWSLTREALQYIHQEAGKGSIYYKHYINTLCTDEIYFQTLLLNSPLKDTFVADNLRYIDWDTGPEWPKLLNEEDFERIVSSGKLYARKFNGVDNKLVKLLQQHHSAHL